MPAATLRSFLMRFAQTGACALVIGFALGGTLPEARAGQALEARPVEMPAEAAPPSGLEAGLEQQVRAIAMGGSAHAPEGVSRIEVVVGQLDSRLRLAPCAKIEPYLPNGTRLWGKSRIGLRCVQGTTLWNVFLPITVKAWGRGLVATTGAPAGSILKAGDVAQADVDLAEDPTVALVDPDQAIGRTLVQPLKAGQGVRAGHLKLRQWFNAGDTVRVLAVGEGFSLESEAQALSNGIEGQPARVRTESGRILTGQPVGDRRLEVAL
jgi:flagella basal body P-ring formation protein FlgA